MSKLKNLNPKRVFHYFEQISSIPRDSGNMKKIADYCENFAVSNNLKCIRDTADNVIIFKPASNGYENSEPIILQGHLDMVCQKTAESTCNFDTDGIDLFIDGDFITANGTTLGADNGIAVAMILAILENNTLAHPPIEAVFTVDEEIGMLGAMQMDMSVFKAHKMINLDSEEDGIVTVSCAGGEDLNAVLSLDRIKSFGTEVLFEIKGLNGGHSGMEINSGRVNADLLMGRMLNEISDMCEYDIISINGGNKSNAIPNRAAAKLCVKDLNAFNTAASKCFNSIKEEIRHREKSFDINIEAGATGEFSVFDNKIKETLLSLMLCLPNGVIEMSAEIENLVETSLNLGILKTYDDRLEMCLSLRSSKKTALDFLAKRLSEMLKLFGFKYEPSGYYPPWEYNSNSQLRDVFCKVYSEHCGKVPQIAAIHAGLECGVFSSGIDNLDCISVGPEMFDVHTTDERLNISSTNRLFEIIIDVLKSLK